MKIFIIIFFTTFLGKLNCQNLIEVKSNNDSLINIYLEKFVLIYCGDTSHIRLSQRKIKKDKRCIIAFLDLLLFIKKKESNNDTLAICYYLKSKKYNFVNFGTEKESVKINLKGSYLHFQFGIYPLKKSLVAVITDTYKERKLCNGYTFINYPYVRDSIIQNLPLKIETIDYDFCRLEGRY